MHPFPGLQQMVVTACISCSATAQEIYNRRAGNQRLPFSTFLYLLSAGDPPHQQEFLFCLILVLVFKFTVSWRLRQYPTRDPLFSAKRPCLCQLRVLTHIDSLSRWGQNKNDMYMNPPPPSIEPLRFSRDREKQVRFVSTSTT